MNYVTLIKIENEDWKIGYGITDNKKQHDKFKKEILEFVVGVEDVKIFEIVEVE